MDNRLVVTALLVTLSWMCLGTHSTASAMNMTGSMNMTNMTGPMHMTNMTNMTGPMNMTKPMNTTGPPPMNMTQPMPNATATPPPLEPNSTVEALTSTIDRQECRKRQFCAAQPADCDPATSDGCFFFGARRIGGRNFRFTISGDSSGYLATSLSSGNTAGVNDTAYICARGKKAVKFFGAILNKGMFTKTQVKVNRVKARVRNGTIQCTFDVTLPRQQTRATDTSFGLAISTGTYNETSGELGTPVDVLRSGVVDLANTNTTVTNQISNNSTVTAAPTTPTTTAHGVSLQQCLSQALLITLGVVGLALL
ncbi:uncharacterized protein LOC143010309 [Genypterus blacodes]|uniref:uncharacterized protein LOC143010309 n=1 Tax=Genypterus blacodes TaxID=154954 RepID=UPI003F76D212